MSRDGLMRLQSPGSHIVAADSNDVITLAADTYTCCYRWRNFQSWHCAPYL